jgi:hypothetical protein
MMGIRSDLYLARTIAARVADEQTVMRGPAATPWRGWLHQP